MTALAPRPRTLGADATVLVDAALDGDDLAWQMLRDRFADQVRRVALARIRDAHAAEDIVQETFLRAWTRLHQLDDPQRVGPWLKTIAARVAIDHVRAQQPTVTLDRHVEQPIVLAPLEDHVVEREAAAVLHAALNDLRETDRIALWQRDALGVPVAELAEQLGMTTGSVRVLLTRARGKVRDGYGLLVLPVFALAGRLRTRIAGLGEALPVAVVAPAVIVAAVAGVIVPSFSSDTAGPGSAQSVVAAPASAANRLDDALAASGDERSALRYMPVELARFDVSDVSGTTSYPASSRETAAAPGRQAAVGAAGGGITVGGPPPTDKDPDFEGDPETPAGGVEGVDLYFEDTIPTSISGVCFASEQACS